MPDIDGIPYVESDDLVSAYPAASQALAQEVSDQLASKLDYPTGGSDGDLLAKDGTDAEWIAVPEAGLTLITSETFSAVSSVSLNGCFSATYQNYRIITSLRGSAHVILRARLRSSGSDATGTDYFLQRIRAQGTSVTGVREANATSYIIGTVDANIGTNLNSFDIADPAETDTTQISGLSYANSTTGSTDMFVFSGTHALETSYTGLTIFPVSGNITGTIRIYGYKD